MIIKNFLPKKYHEEILKITASDEFPWFYNESISGKTIGSVENFSEIQYGFAHVLFNERGENSIFYNFFSPILYFIEEKTGIEIQELIRIRIGLNTKIGEEEILHLPHIDYYEPHKVFLYYVNDSDGDTVMYNETFNGNDQKTFSIKERIIPEANKGILFDGLRYHSSSSPVINTKRIAININFR